MNKIQKRENSTMLVSIIGDEDTVTGMLLTGIGERSSKGETNFFKVNSKTPAKDIEQAFKQFSTNPNIAIVLITQDIAEKYLRHLIQAHDAILPTILEIPGKETTYELSKDMVMQKANRLLYGNDLAL